MLFSEDRLVRKDASYGSIEIICGSMFSGKTEELIRRIRRAQLAKLGVQIFKPAIDVRYHEETITSHDGNRIPSTSVDSSSAILLLTNGAKVIGIDEAQFFDDELPEICNQLANNGIRVIAAGLDMDFKGRPFGPVPALMAVAEHVTKVHAVCVRCGRPATYSYRIIEEERTLLLGQKESYEPRCRACFYNGKKI